MKLLFLLLASICSLFANANDLEMFCLKGSVDSVCIIMNDAGLEWQTEFSFDKDGKLVRIDDNEFDCKRDAKGRIASITVEDAVEDDENVFTTIEMQLTYDNSGRVTKVRSTSTDETWEQIYRYDEKGLLKERGYDSADEDETLKYVYLKFDKHGNWTERLEKLSSMDQTIAQTRHIIYRNQSKH